MELGDGRHPDGHVRKFHLKKGDTVSGRGRMMGKEGIATECLLLVTTWWTMG